MRKSGKARPVAHQAANRRKLSEFVSRRERMTLGQCDKLDTLAKKRRIVADEYRADLSTDKLRECWFEVIRVARLGD